MPCRHRALPPRASGAAGDAPCHPAFCPSRATTIIIGRTIIAGVFVRAVFVFSLAVAAASSGEQRARRGRRCALGASPPARRVARCLRSSQVLLAVRGQMVDALNELEKSCIFEA